MVKRRRRFRSPPRRRRHGVGYLGNRGRDQQCSRERWAHDSPTSLRASPAPYAAARLSA